MDRYHIRRDKLRKVLHKSGAEAMLVTNFTNVTYLTGFTGDDSYLLLRSDGELVVSDPRYTTQLQEECPGIETVIRAAGAGMLETLERVVKQSKLDRLAIEADSMSVALRDQIADKLPKLPLVNTSGLVEQLRVLKDQHEIAEIRRAVWQAERAYNVLRNAPAGTDRKGGSR